MRRMRSGLLRERVELQRAVRASDGQGGWVESWNTYASVWANVAPVSASERQTAMQSDARARYEVTIRSHPGLRAPDRLLWGVKVMDVTSPPVNHDEKGRYLTIEASYDSDLTVGSYLPGVDDLAGTRSGSAAILEVA